MNELNSNNKVTLTGTIITNFTFNHEVFGEKFYMAYLNSERKSGTADIIPLMVSERIIDVTEDFIGCRIEVEGYFRSYSTHTEDKNRLILSVLVTGIYDAGNSSDSNDIVLEGFICKKPIYRTTPLGREITDILIAVNRAYGKSDYIPCLTWGRNAGFTSGVEVGTKLHLEGRIQSRTYTKQLSEHESEERTAYEVSVSKLKVLGAN